MCDTTITPDQAKRKLTSLKRKRETRFRNAPCHRCGGQGGAQAWAYTGYTCYRCGGQNSMRFEVIKERYWPTPELQAEADALEAIIRAEEERLFEIRRQETLKREKEQAHEAALREDALRAERAAQPFLGTVGEPLTFEGTCIFQKDVHTFYGTSCLLLIKDEATGGVVKLFGTGQTLWAVEKGFVVRGKGTVKEHAKWNDSKSTVVTRAKLEIVSQPE